MQSQRTVKITLNVAEVREALKQYLQQNNVLTSVSVDTTSTLLLSGDLSSFADTNDAVTITWDEN